MVEIESGFSKKFDQSMLDTQSPLGRFQGLLALLDRELCVALVRKQLDARFYALRWLTLLFSQELELPDVLRLWDSLLGDPHRFRFLLFCACAMVMSVRTQLLAEDFGPCLVLLQDMPVPDVAALIADAAALMDATDPRCLEPAYLAHAYSEVVAEAEAPKSPQQQSQQQQHQHHHIFGKVFGFSRNSSSNSQQKTKK